MGLVFRVLDGSVKAIEQLRLQCESAAVLLTTAAHASRACANSKIFICRFDGKGEHRSRLQNICSPTERDASRHDGTRPDMRFSFDVLDSFLMPKPQKKKRNLYVFDDFSKFVYTCFLSFVGITPYKPSAHPSIKWTLGPKGQGQSLGPRAMSPWPRLRAWAMGQGP